MSDHPQDVVDELLPRAELIRPRSAPELVRWVAERCEMISRVPEARRPALLHRLTFKQFYEEIYPFAMFVRHRYPDRDDVICRPNLDNRDFDAEISDPAAATSVKVEITLARAPDEHVRMEFFIEHGHVSIWGPITAVGTKATGGHQITQEPLAVDHAELRARYFGWIKTAAEGKARKQGRYGAQHVLVIAFDDWQWFEPPDFQALTPFIEQEVLVLPLNFAALYVVGMSGKTFAEFRVGRSTAVSPP